MGLWDSVVDGLNKAGDAVEDALEEGLEKGGQAVDAALDAAADGARKIGADGLGDKLDDLGDGIANSTGGKVDEKELGETEDKRELIRGDSGSINDRASKLTSMAQNIESTGEALSKINAADWTGNTADAFNAVYDKQPGLWHKASAAMTATAATMSGWGSTVEWAQSQAAEAIALWRDAEQEERRQKERWNALSDEGKEDTPLTDTWSSKYEEAKRVLKAARTERDSIAGEVGGKISTHTGNAPTEPPFLNRMGANLEDLRDAGQHALLNVESGLATSLTGLVQFVRQNSFQDPYNLTHPAEYFKSIGNLVTGAVTTVADPGATIHSITSDARKKPFNFVGSLAGDALLTAGTGGAGGAAAAGKAGIRAAQASAKAAEAARVGARATEGAVRHAAKEGEHAAKGAERAGKDAEQPKSAAEPSGDKSTAATESAGDKGDGKPPVQAEQRSEPAPEAKDDKGTGSQHDGPASPADKPDGNGSGHQGADPDRTDGDRGPEKPAGAGHDTTGVEKPDGSGDSGSGTDHPHREPDAPSQHAGDGNSTPESRADADQQAPQAAEDAGHSNDQTPEETTEHRDPVDVATGEFLLPETDLDLPGILPLVVKRRHRSSYRFGRWFGPSWSSTLDMRVVESPDGVTLLAEDGVMIVYPHPRVDEPVEPRDARQRWTLSRTDGGGYRVHDPDREISWHFAPEPEMGGVDRALGNLALSAITDRFFNRIRLRYDAVGTPVAIHHSGGYRVEVDTHAGRVTALSVLSGLDDEPTVLREFDYTAGHLTSVRTPTGGHTRYVYDDDGQMTSWLDSNGNQMINSYDADGRVVRQAGTDSIMSATFDYLSSDDGAESVTVVTDSVGARSMWGFDRDLRLRDFVSATGARSHTDYNERREPLAVTASDGSVTRYLYTPEGDLAQLTRPDGRAIRVDYVAAGRPSAIYHVDGTTTRQEWDDKGNLLAVVDVHGGRTEYTYRADGTLVSVVDPTGGRTLIECNAAGLPEVITDPVGAVTIIDRDGFGRPIVVTDPIGAITEYHWTPEGQLAARVNADGTTETWEYDGERNLLRHVDANGGVTTHTYGAFDLLMSTTATNGSTTHYDWDTERRLRTVTNPLGLTWRYDYDADGRVVGETDFNEARTTYEYDTAGRVATITSPTGVTRRLTYDILGRLLEIRADTGEFRSYTYDVAGRRLTAVSGAGADVAHQIDFGYSPVGDLVREDVDTGASVLEHTYDRYGRRTLRHSASGGRTGWQWGAHGRASAVDVDGRTVGLDYDSRGAASGWRVGEVAVRRAHDDRGRLSVQEVEAFPVRPLNLGDGPARPEPQLVRADSFDYRPDGFLSGQTTRSGGGVVPRAFDVDAGGRITGITEGGERRESYAYDGLSNLVAVGDERREFRGNLLVADGRTRYRYDSAGRVVEKSVARLSRRRDVWRFSWDGFDQLVGVVTPDGAVWRYSYDALGRRVCKWRVGVDGSVVELVRFVWDEVTLVEVVSSEEVMRWVYRPGSFVPLTQSRVDLMDQGAVDAEFFALVTDVVGSPVEVLDVDRGVVVGRARSSVWGATVWSGAVSSPLRFPGQFFDVETGWHYNLHRFYDPVAARFVSSDPLGLAPSPNPMGYPFNPTAWTDPLGLVPSGCEFGHRIPEESLRIIDQIRDSGVIWEHGVKGADIPVEYRNDGRSGSATLPKFDSELNPIEYREWGTVPSSKNPSPGSERIVTGSDGSIYYTPDHYKRFIRWSPIR